jgi:hypothetical protein
MMFRAAVVLIALAMPVFAQRGGGHAGSSGSRGFAGHAGFSGHSGFSRSTSPVRPAQPARYRASGIAGFREMGPPNHSNFGNPYNGSRLPAGRPSYHSTGTVPSAAWNRGGDRNRDLYAARRRSFENWYVNNYPTWLGYGYPYVIDPGFYDWGDSDNSADNSAYDQSGAAPYYLAPYPDYGYGAPDETPQEGVPGGNLPANAQVPEQPLTVIFSSGRSPVKIQNYMMNAKVLIDLDSQHYEQIPIDQIDVAATQRVNRAAGVGFEIPDASGN